MRKITDEKRFNIRMNGDTHRDFRMLAAYDKTSVQNIMSDMIEKYLPAAIHRMNVLKSKR